MARDEVSELEICTGGYKMRDGDGRVGTVEMRNRTD